MKYTINDYLMDKESNVWSGRPLEELRHLELALENEVTYNRRNLDRRREVLRRQINGEDVRYAMGIRKGGGVPQERKNEYCLRRAISGIRRVLK
jgi:hypothetical protein